MFYEANLANSNRRGPQMRQTFWYDLCSTFTNTDDCQSEYHIRMGTRLGFDPRRVNLHILHITLPPSALSMSSSYAGVALLVTLLAYGFALMEAAVVQEQLKGTESRVGEHEQQGALVYAVALAPFVRGRVCEELIAALHPVAYNRALSSFTRARLLAQFKPHARPNVHALKAVPLLLTTILPPFDSTPAITRGTPSPPHPSSARHRLGRLPNCSRSSSGNSSAETVLLPARCGSRMVGSWVVKVGVTSGQGAKMDLWPWAFGAALHKLLPVPQLLLPWPDILKITRALVIETRALLTQQSADLDLGHTLQVLAARLV
ncbi:hypothetical protein FIBSPDRAFT_901924 [Athelia psychrophila]|uniref:Uncharacterized protein n=1 Tax=Athelia psychrophila TaxID=1759441 RepID=A0A165WFQ0_9AGAM|nr:hypothetical protein FIBSPDRAFT_901924 [Fibularhizoctonia sp. CBS 109695]